MLPKNSLKTLQFAAGRGAVQPGTNLKSLRELPARVFSARGHGARAKKAIFFGVVAGQLARLPILNQADSLIEVVAGPKRTQSFMG